MPDWTHFQEQHVLDPSRDPGYAGWGRDQWNDWLKQRIPSQFGQKRINSVVISSPQEILNDFETLSASHTTGPDFYWSNNKYRIFYLTLDNRNSSNPYGVRDFGQMYFLAKISRDPNVPVHFHRQNSTHISRGNVNLKVGDYREIQ